MTEEEEFKIYRAAFPAQIGNSLIGLGDNGKWWRMDFHGNETIHDHFSGAIDAAGGSYKPTEK